MIWQRWEIHLPQIIMTIWKSMLPIVYSAGTATGDVRLKWIRWSGWKKSPHTLKNNICLFQDYDSKQINEIINKTGLNQLVASLPEGLNSKIKENGANLSGGQKQKIAIARALLKQKEIIFIDEGTSNLDNLSAYEIEKIILDSKAMIISITHHLKKELLEKYDEILVLDQGKIIESGSYNELIANQQLFYQLLCKQ